MAINQHVQTEDLMLPTFFQLTSNISRSLTQLI